MKKENKINRDSLYIGNIKTSNITEEETQESCVNSFLKGVRNLKKKVNETKR